jgi:hypothetical protein
MVVMKQRQITPASKWQRATKKHKRETASCSNSMWRQQRVQHDNKTMPKHKQHVALLRRQTQANTTPLFSEQFSSSKSNEMANRRGIQHVNRSSYLIQSMTVSYIGHIGIQLLASNRPWWRRRGGGNRFLFEWAPSWYFHDSQPNKSL